MFPWVNSSGSLAGKIAKLVCYSVFVVVFASCGRGCDIRNIRNMQSHPHCMLTFLSVDDNDSLCAYPNKAFSLRNIDVMYSESETSIRELPALFKKNGWVRLSVEFPEDIYTLPKSIDGIFVIENKSSVPQRCFVSISGGYPTVGTLYGDQVRGSIRFNDLIRRVDLLKEQQRQGYEGYTIEDYWVDVNKINPKVALVVPPKTKIYTKWE